jgi:hypothetical protein
MLTMCRVILPAILLAAVSVGCARHTSGAQSAAEPREAQSPAEPPEAQTASAHYPVIVRMVARRSTITITAGPRGPLYSAATSSGQPLVTNATLEQLRSDHPDICRQVEPTVALDARAD